MTDDSITAEELERLFMELRSSNSTPARRAAITHLVEPLARRGLTAERLERAARALLQDVHHRYPGEDLRCPFMRELEAALPPPPSQNCSGPTPIDPEGEQTQIGNSPVVAHTSSQSAQEKDDGDSIADNRSDCPDRGGLGASSSVGLRLGNSVDENAGQVVAPAHQPGGEELDDLQREWDQMSGIMEQIGAGPLPGASPSPQGDVGETMLVLGSYHPPYPQSSPDIAGVKERLAMFDPRDTEAIKDAIRVIEQQERKLTVYPPALDRAGKDIVNLSTELAEAQARCEELEKEAAHHCEVRVEYEKRFHEAQAELREAHARYTDYDSLASEEICRLQAEIERLRAALERIFGTAYPHPSRTFDTMIRDIGLIDDIARTALGDRRG